MRCCFTPLWINFHSWQLVYMSLSECVMWWTWTRQQKVTLSHLTPKDTTCITHLVPSPYTPTRLSCLSTVSQPYTLSCSRSVGSLHWSDVVTMSHLLSRWWKYRLLGFDVLRLRISCAFCIEPLLTHKWTRLCLLALYDYQPCWAALKCGIIQITCQIFFNCMDVFVYHCSLLAFMYSAFSLAQCILHYIYEVVRYNNTQARYGCGCYRPTGISKQRIALSAQNVKMTPSSPMGSYHIMLLTLSCPLIA